MYTALKIHPTMATRRGNLIPRNLPKTTESYKSQGLTWIRQLACISHHCSGVSMKRRVQSGLRFTEAHLQIGGIFILW